MIKTKIPDRIKLLTILLFCIAPLAAAGQQLTAEKTDSVAAYVRDKAEDSGLIRKRIVSEPAKPVRKYSTVEVFDFEKQAFALINFKRAEMGLPALQWSDDVAKIARLHSENMVKFRFFGHQGVDGKMVNDRADSLGMKKWTAIGENIAFNRGYQEPIECAVQRWMESPSHRENLLDKRWKESAIGISIAADGTFYFTQVFMVRR
ncbi:MAG: CAP domain-containing protein [Acidobacteria bacterium]|nr:CAP domain-containing protein [Acidobacteriota bacterium]